MKYNWWSLYWLIWIGVLFMGPEVYALATGNPQNTLSYQVWHIEGTGATFARYFVAAFLIWLFVHMVFRMFR